MPRGVKTIRTTDGTEKTEVCICPDTPCNCSNVTELRSELLNVRQNLKRTKQRLGETLTGIDAWVAQLRASQKYAKQVRESCEKDFQYVDQQLKRVEQLRQLL
jgi:hypothetical protein